LEGIRPTEETSPSSLCRAFLLKLGRTPDPAKRRRILGACARISLPWAEELLWEALADPCESIRDLVTKALCVRPMVQLGLAVRRLHGPPWFARSAALTIIGHRRAGEAVNDVGLAAGDANAAVRQAAALALGEMGGEEAVRYLVLLKKDAHPYVRAAADRALGKTSGVRFS
jgi:HEAT repeat protein